MMKGDKEDEGDERDEFSILPLCWFLYGVSPFFLPEFQSLPSFFCIFVVFLSSFSCVLLPWKKGIMSKNVLVCLPLGYGFFVNKIRTWSVKTTNPHPKQIQVPRQEHTFTLDTPPVRRHIHKQD